MLVYFCWCFSPVNHYRSKEVTKIGDGKFTVKWEDPDGGPEESEVDPKAPHQSGGQEFST